MPTEVTQEQLEAVNDILQGGANVGTKTTSASQNASQTQESTASNTQESEGSSTQTSSVEYKPVEQRVYDESKALQYMESMPFVDALKLAGIEKPDPKVLEDAKRRQKYRANAATLAETLRVLSDIGSGFAGGNVYARDNKDVEKANADYDKEETAYNTKLNSYQQQLLQGILNDRATKLNLLNDIEKTFGRQNKTESENKQTNTTKSSQKTTSNSKQNTSQTIVGDNKTSGKKKGNSWDVMVPINENGKIRYKSIPIKNGENGWKSYLQNSADIILRNDNYLSQLASMFTDGDVEDVKDILLSSESEDQQKRINMIISMASQDRALLDVLTKSTDGDLSELLGADNAIASASVLGNGILQNATYVKPQKENNSTTLWEWNN